MVLLIISATMFLFLVIHASLSRFAVTSGGRQLFLIKIILAANIFMLALYWSCVVRDENWLEVIHASVYMLLTFNGFTYSYFHLFNMSETARRIRILRVVSEQQCTVADVGQLYNSRDMIMQRLERLIDLGQIEPNGSAGYRLRSRTMLIVGDIFLSVSKIVMGRNR